MSRRPRVYCYSGCGTCRKALQWLSEHGVDVELIAIREQPPTAAELRRALSQHSSLRALFNTSGGDYKALRLKERLAEMSPAQAIELLASHGNLVKRPFLVLPGGPILVGFDADAYAAVFR